MSVLLALSLSLSRPLSLSLSLYPSLQASLAGLISYCDLTAWWKDWHVFIVRHTHTHTQGQTLERHGQGPVWLDSITPPWARPRGEEGGGRRGEGHFCLLNVIVCLRADECACTHTRTNIPTHTDTSTHTNTQSAFDLRQRYGGLRFL